MAEWTPEKIRAMLRLTQRSEDIGDGWRQCSHTVFALLLGFPEELMEQDLPKHRVRVTSAGEAVVKYGCPPQ